MGWLFMTTLKGHATPKAYLDAQFTFEQPTGVFKVLKSALVNLRTYYAAVEQAPIDGDRVVFGLVCLVRYNPRDREGYIFGYKDMAETMGPVESGCPAAILDLLTPTQNAYALDWRARCRAEDAARRERAAKPLPCPGQVVVFADPVLFADGRSLTRLTAVRLPRRRGVVFRSEAGGLYRIPGLKALAYRIEEPAEARQPPLL